MNCHTASSHCSVQLAIDPSSDRELAKDVEEFLAERRPMSPFLQNFTAQDAIAMVAGTGRWDNIKVRSTPGGAADMMKAMVAMQKSGRGPSLF